ncbi:MAG TPA: ZIP family metal transporter [Candidatus Acidoferrales bacterium]|nr:ZIP family metal transporter [Candidatus Acidoferrales bacterium]
MAIRASPAALAAILGLTAATANVLGGLFIVRGDWSRQYLKYFVALGAGFMLAAAFLEVIPESLRLAGHVGPLLVLGGYFLVHFFEHTLAPHFHFGEETHLEEMTPHHVGYAALLGLVIHTFFDGVAIASGFLISTWLGGVIFLAVFLHKLPEGFTVSSLMLASGQSRRTALLAAVLLGAATLGGVFLMNVLRARVSYALPISAGVTVYVAASDLMPEVNREPGVAMAFVVFIGVALLLVLHGMFHF